MLLPGAHHPTAHRHIILFYCHVQLSYSSRPITAQCGPPVGPPSTLKMSSLTEGKFNIVCLRTAMFVCPYCFFFFLIVASEMEIQVNLGAQEQQQQQQQHSNLFVWLYYPHFMRYFKPPFSVRRTPIDGLCLWPEKLRVKRITHSEGAGTLQHISKLMSFNSYPSSSRARSNQKGFRLEVKSCMFSVIHQIKMPQPHILHMCYIVYNGMMWCAYLTHE